MIKVVEAMEAIVSAVKTRRLRGARLAAPGDGGVVQPTLDYYSDAPDSYSRPLDETGIHVVTAGRRAERARVLGVDGSSRRFSTPYGSLALATVALTYGPLPCSITRRWVTITRSGASSRSRSSRLTRRWASSTRATRTVPERTTGLLPGSFLCAAPHVRLYFNE
jgi:hypothetical protein